jgi:tetratricopeptide (TPR) repeat protein
MQALFAWTVVLTSALEGVFGGGARLGWASVRWWARRRWLHLAWAAPALLVTVVGAKLAVGWTVDESNHDLVVAQRCLQALQVKNYPSARLYALRLIQDGPENLKHQFLLAVSLHGLGKAEQAERMIGRLAPDQAAGLPEAHLWRVRTLLTAWDHTRASAALIEHHLTICARWFPKQVVAGCGPVAAGLVPAVPNDLSLTLAQLYRALGNEPASAAWNRRALEIGRLAVSTRPDDRRSRLAWAEAAKLGHDFRLAVRILEEGANNESAAEYDRPLAEAYALLCLNQWDALQKKPEEILSLIQAGLTHDVHNAILLRQLVALASQPGEHTAPARQTVEKLATSAAPPSCLFLCLGIEAWQRRQLRAARAHLEKAVSLAPDDLVAANNLAYVLLAGPPADWPRALAIASGIVARQPDDAHFRETRGEILAKLGRWDEALTDLELAAAKLSPNRQLHLLLSDAYAHLGRKDKAAEQIALMTRFPQRGPAPAAGSTASDSASAK